MSRPSVFDLSSQSHFQQTCREHREKLNAICCFTRDHKRYPSSASALFVFVRSFAMHPHLLLAWKFTILCLYLRTHTALLFDANLLSLVISTRSRNQLSTTKINKILPPKLFPPAGLHNSGEITTHRPRHLLSKEKVAA